MPLEPTPGAPDADTYADLDEFDAYATSRVPSLEWYVTATDPQKEAALVGSARLLDSYLVWTGLASSGTQSMAWPRVGMYNRNGFAIPTDEIPAALKNAQSEWALQLGAGDLLSDNDAAKKNVKRVKAGSVEVEFQDTDVSSTDLVDAALQQLAPELLWTKVPDAVRALLVPSWYVRDTLSRAKYGRSSFRVY